MSAVLTGLLLPMFSEQTGLPIGVLHGLALLPVAYALYSLSRYFLMNVIKPSMLKTIIAANLFYCLLSAILLTALPDVTVWGCAVLIAEILVVLAVVAIEIKIYRN